MGHRQLEKQKPAPLKAEGGGGVEGHQGEGGSGRYDGARDEEHPSEGGARGGGGLREDGRSGAEVEDGSERAEVGLSGTMTRDLTSEVEKGLKELDSTSDHPRIPFDGDRNSKEVWLRTEGGENIRLVHTSSRGFGLQFPAARRRPLSEKDDLAFVMVTKLHPTEDVLKFVQSWNSKAKKYKDNDGKNSPPLFYTSDSFSLSFSWLLLTLSPFSLSLSLSVRKEKLDILRTRDGKNAACYVVSRSIAHLLNTPGKGEDGKLHTPTHELTNPEQPKEEVAFWIWRARAKLETKLNTSTPLSSHRFFSYADPAVSFLSLSPSRTRRGGADDDVRVRVERSPATTAATARKAAAECKNPKDE